MAILTAQIFWTEDVKNVLEEFENGQLDSVRGYLDLCNTRLESLIEVCLNQSNAFTHASLHTHRHTHAYPLSLTHRHTHERTHIAAHTSPHTHTHTHLPPLGGDW